MSASDTPKAADRARGWPLRCRDARGLRVKLKREASNRLVRLPAGTTGRITGDTGGWHKLDFEGEECGCCGVAPVISRMSWRSFEPVPEPCPTAADLGFVERAATPVVEMRRSIHRSHRGEGQNFVD